MNDQLSRLLRPDIEEMESYTPIVPFEVLSRRLGLQPEDMVKLDANENPYGPSPRAMAALADEGWYHIYPDPEQTLLREAMEKHLGLPREHIIFGNGSDEIIDLTMRLFVMPGDAVVNLPPTFGMYSYNTSLCAGRLISVPRRADFSIDVPAVEAVVAAEPRAKILFVNSPNNPDGSLVSPRDLERLLQLPIIVVLDEAYAEFAGVSYVDLVPRHWNLVVLRTFSKWAGLGGLRVGYGLFPRQIAVQLWKIKPPYSVNSAARVMALASLEDADYLMQRVSAIVSERERIYCALQDIDGIAPYPSRANYILSRVQAGSSLALKKILEARGVLVRYYDKPGLDDCIRISVGTPAQNDIALSALSQELAALQRPH